MTRLWKLRVLIGGQSRLYTGNSKIIGQLIQRSVSFDADLIFWAGELDGLF